MLRFAHVRARTSDSAPGWQPIAAGLSIIGLYFNPETGLYRIVGIDMDSSEATLNAALVVDTEYEQASERFHQFADHEGKVFGINFASDEVRHDAGRCPLTRRRRRSRLQQR